MRALYSLLILALQPLLLLKLWRRGRAEPLYRQAIGERFGRYGHRATAMATARPEDSDASAQMLQRPVWIHAVSLGETRAAALLIDELRRQEPDVRILLTHGTATGRAEGAKLLEAGDAQAWLPWDTPGATRRFLQHFQPRLGVLMETEVWPNLIDACKVHGTPLALANARLSEKSMRNALRLASLSRPAYASLAAVWAQTEADARRLARVGAQVAAVHGNLKFDATPDAVQLQQGRRWHAETKTAAPRPVLMFASSREGEEAMLLEVIQSNHAPAQAGRAQAAIDSIANDVQWLIVPRHPQRFDEVEAMVKQAGLSVSRRSIWNDNPQAADVWLGDSLGEMALYYGLADVALLGGSFQRLGGQNLIEAAACGCPVVMGPHTFNFEEAALLAQAAGAAIGTGSMEEAVRIAGTLAGSATPLATAAQAGTDFAAAHRGAAGKTARAILALAWPGPAMAACGYSR